MKRTPAEGMCTRINVVFAVGYPQKLWITLWMAVWDEPVNPATFAELSNWSNFRHPIFALLIN
jgi:hypothetical protein